MTTGSSFHRVLWDGRDARMPDADLADGRGALKAAKDIRRVVLCSGKVYFDCWKNAKRKILTMFI